MSIIQFVSPSTDFETEYTIDLEKVLNKMIVAQDVPKSLGRTSVHVHSLLTCIFLGGFFNH